MKDFIKNVVFNVFATYIVLAVGAVAPFIIGFFSTRNAIYLVVAGGVLALEIGVVYIMLFGIAKFRWSHFFSYDYHSLELINKQTATDTNRMRVKKRSMFDGKIKGDYDWLDVSVKQVEMTSEDATIEFNYEDQLGKKNVTKGKNEIKVEGTPIKADYVINFDNNNVNDVTMKVSMEYEEERMASEYYVDVSRPIRKLVIELKVKKGVKINNVRKEISAQYGDEKILFSKELKWKKDKSDSVTIYTYVIRNPRLFCYYRISWDWIEL